MSKRNLKMRLAAMASVLVFLLSATAVPFSSASAQNASQVDGLVAEALGFARDYAARYGHELSPETLAVIEHGIRSNLDGSQGTDEVRARSREAIVRLIDEMKSLSARANEKPTSLGGINLALALQSICPVWPIC